MCSLKQDRRVLGGELLECHLEILRVHGYLPNNHLPLQVRECMGSVVPLLVAGWVYTRGSLLLWVEAMPRSYGCLAVVFGVLPAVGLLYLVWSQAGYTPLNLRKCSNYK